MTIRNHAATALAIAQAFESTYSKIDPLEDDAYRPAFLVQPISQAQLQESDNIIGLDKEKEPLLRMCSSSALESWVTQY